MESYSSEQVFILTADLDLSGLDYDPAPYFAEFIKNDLAASNLLCDKNERFEEFYVSASAEKFALASKLFYDLPQGAKEYSF